MSWSTTKPEGYLEEYKARKQQGQGYIPVGNHFSNIKTFTKLRSVLKMLFVLRKEQTRCFHALRKWSLAWIHIPPFIYFPFKYLFRYNCVKWKLSLRFSILKAKEGGKKKPRCYHLSLNCSTMPCLVFLLIMPCLLGAISHSISSYKPWGWPYLLFPWEEKKERETWNANQP